MAEEIVAAADYGLNEPSNLFRVVESDRRVEDVEPWGNHLFHFTAERRRRRMMAGRTLPSYHLRVERFGRRWRLVAYQNHLEPVDFSR